MQCSCAKWQCAFSVRARVLAPSESASSELTRMRCLTATQLSFGPKNLAQMGHMMVLMLLRKSASGVAVMLTDPNTSSRSPRAISLPTLHAASCSSKCIRSLAFPRRPGLPTTRSASSMIRTILDRPFLREYWSRRSATDSPASAWRPRRAILDPRRRRCVTLLSTIRTEPVYPKPCFRTGIWSSSVRQLVSWNLSCSCSSTPISLRCSAIIPSSFLMACFMSSVPDFPPELRTRMTGRHPKMNHVHHATHAASPDLPLWHLPTITFSTFWSGSLKLSFLIANFGSPVMYGNFLLSHCTAL
mmetsp:Transcript_40383/g.95982  ORF Transcript_40383/g.95982 Transcript_40383/m.95982 type:complete len:301 (+) Transcript_40383:2181-3083(+)